MKFLYTYIGDFHGMIPCLDEFRVQEDCDIHREVVRVIGWSLMDVRGVEVCLKWTGNGCELREGYQLVCCDFSQTSVVKMWWYGIVGSDGRVVENHLWLFHISYDDGLMEFRGGRADVHPIEDGDKVAVESLKHCSDMDVCEHKTMLREQHLRFMAVKEATDKLAKELNDGNC